MAQIMETLYLPPHPLLSPALSSHLNIERSADVPYGLQRCALPRYSLAPAVLLQDDTALGSTTVRIFPLLFTTVLPLASTASTVRNLSSLSHEVPLTQILCMTSTNVHSFLSQHEAVSYTPP